MTTTTDSHLTACMNLIDEILKPVKTYTCVECGQRFTDPEEYAYGHDCEVES
jgi:uncharacterized protein YlaI